MYHVFKRITHSVVNTVNNVSRPTNKTIDALAPRTRRKQFLADLVLAGQYHFLVGTFSEASIRIGKDYFLTHPASKHPGFLSDEDLDILSIGSDWSLKRIPPPKHVQWHRWIYQHTPAKAVILCHPNHVFKIWGRKKKFQATGLGGSLRYPDGFEISDKEADGQMITGHSFLLVPGEGLLTWGNGIQDLIWKIDELDWICSLET